MLVQFNGEHDIIHICIFSKTEYGKRCTDRELQLQSTFCIGGEKKGLREKDRHDILVGFVFIYI